MVTLILPGYSLKNKDWALETAGEVALSHEVRPILWDHWVDPDKKFDAKVKAGDIIDILLKESANIIAKSIGTLVASYVIRQNPGEIQKVIFCGIPLNDLTESDKEEISQALKLFPAKNILIIQNEEDPHGGITQLREFLKASNLQIKVIAKPRNDHEYPYFSEFQGFLKANN